MEEKEEKYALISVYNKAGIEDDVRRLVSMGWNVISSGGTAKTLAGAGIPVKDVAELVGGGAILGHRVVTLSREVHAGLLADALKPEDLAELVSLHIPFIDLVRCDFYPLSEAIANHGAIISKVVDMTDIGGPCMVRSGAKGLRIVVCRQQDMEGVLRELEATGDVSAENRQKLRARAEYEVARYVGESAVYHGQGKFIVAAGEQVGDAFKGENGPQSPAMLYSHGTNDPLALDRFQLIAGVPLSYNNWCDLDRLIQTMTHLAAGWYFNFGVTPMISIGVKHGNPCGAMVSHSPIIAATNMVAGDRRAIFGGFVMCNFRVNGEIAKAMAEIMPDGTAKFDGVVAPDFDTLAIDTLSRIKGKCRIIVNDGLNPHPYPMELDITPRSRPVRGGTLIQPNYTYILNLADEDMTILSGNDHRVIDKGSMLIAWAIGCTSNSNTITIVKDRMLIGNGVGQQDRVGAAKLAIQRAIEAGHEDKLKGATAYSDSYFPVEDAPGVLIDAGIKTIFSTTGSINDAATQNLCVKKRVTLYQLPDTQARGFFGH